MLDPRLTPARPDLAAKRLEGKLEAERFVEGVLYEVIDPQAPLRRVPALDAPLDTEALRGERVVIYEDNGEGWCWGELLSDGYVGYLPQQALAPPGPAPTHRVTALRTFVFPGPSIKIAPLMALPLGSRVAVARFDKGFAVLASGGGGCIPMQHLAPADAVEPDFVAVAERFVGVPYLWGGKTSLGIDCSGLVQVALTAAGIACPRDSDMQERALGEPVEAAAAGEFRRGDLFFWKGHVAIARDAGALVHANAHHMAVAVEPVAQALGRIETAGGALTSVRRIV